MRSLRTLFRKPSDDDDPNNMEHSDSPSSRQVIEPDLPKIRSAVDLLWEPRDVHELRAIDTRQGTRAGWYDDPEKFANAAYACSSTIYHNGRGPVPGGAATCVWTTLNPTVSECLARLNNRFKTYAKQGELTNDEQIVRRQRLLFDADAERLRGISATDEEHGLALARALDLREFLQEFGIWTAFCDSGNGGHLIGKTDLPNNEESTELVKRVLRALNAKFGGGGVKIDAANCNPSRCVKLYGTVSRKGENMPDRPHRLAEIIELSPKPEALILREHLERLVDHLSPKEQPRAARTASNSTRTNNHKSLTQDEITEALNFITDVDDRDLWLRVGMALKSEFGDSGRTLWDQWSKRSAKYDAADQSKTWNSIDAAGAVKIGSLIKLARDGGWTGPKRAHADCHQHNSTGPTSPQSTQNPIYRPPTIFIFDKLDPEAMLEEVTRRFAYLKELDDIADLDDYIIRSQDGFTAYACKYNALKKDEETGRWTKVHIPSEWRQSPERIELVKPLYEPGLPFPICEIDGRLYFNQWRGFAAEPEEGDVSPLIKIVDHVFEGLPDEREHFLKFHAFARQHPDQKIMHAEMLISRHQGIGKSLTGEMIGHGVWSERNFSEVEHGHLSASFNNFLKHKKFILANEMLLSSSTSLDKRRDANLIKNAITRDRVEINDKYIRQYFTRDVLCWML